MPTAPRQMSARELLHIVDTFNNKNPVGTLVRYTAIRGMPSTARETRTKGEAYVLGGHTASVHVEGVSGCVCLSHIDVLGPPPQPPEAAAISFQEVGAALALCHRLRDGADKMAGDQFYQALRRTIGCDRQYADGVIIGFKDNPAAYLASRSPQTQSAELLRVMLELTASK